MRWFAKPVRGQQPLHGFESRPLRQFKLIFVGRLGDDSLQAGAAIFVHWLDFADPAIHFFTGGLDDRSHTTR